jgi:multidrug efflux pump subunit AcrA (membrane-fusion protein)
MPVVLLFFIATIFAWRTLPAYLDQRQQASQNVFSAAITATGLLRSPVYNLAFQSNTTNAVISDIDVQMGQHVHRGQVLARLNSNALHVAVTGWQLAVAADRNYVTVTLNWLQRALQLHTFLVNAAQDALWVATQNLNAITLQQQAAVAAAQARLIGTTQVLANVRVQAAAQVGAAQAQFAVSKLACETAAKGSSSGSADETLKLCLANAEAKLKQATANAQNPVLKNLATVVNNRALVLQALAAARTAITRAQGLAIIARNAVPIAIYEVGAFVAERNVADAQHVLAGDTSSLWQAQATLLDAVLVAPHDGIVSAINGNVGSLAGTVVNKASFAARAAPPGIPNPVVQLTDLDHVSWMLLNVSESDIINVKAGQRVQFTVAASGNRQFYGYVKSISPNGVYTGGKVGFPVVVDIDTNGMQGLRLYPNMTASATIVA